MTTKRIRKVNEINVFNDNGFIQKDILARYHL